MTRLKLAMRRLAPITKALRGAAADLHVYAGIVLVAYGAGQIPTWGTVLAPILIGVGLIWIVRAGGEPPRRR